MDTAKQKINAGTTKTVNFAKVGRQIQSKLSRVEVPALTFSFSSMFRAYWDALWGGHTLPFQLRIDGKVSKETLIGRLGFATTFIVADSIYLLCRFGTWILKRLPCKLNIWNVVMVAGFVIGFIGWGFPLFLEKMDFMSEIEGSKTMMALTGISLPEVSLPEIRLGWAGLIPLVWFVGSIPVSIVRFKKYSGVKSVFGKKPNMGDDE